MWKYVIDAMTLFKVKASILSFFVLKSRRRCGFFSLRLKKFVKIPENTIFQENIGEIMWDGTKKSYAYCENANKTA